jgi:putative transposase
VYYKRKKESSLNILLKQLIKEKYKNRPFYGVPRMYYWLRKDLGYEINKKRVERLYYKELELHAIMPKRNLSKANKEHEKYPYLLNDIEIEKVNQVWQTDITYVPMRKGFMYLTAIIDVFSRMVISWSVSNTMSSKWCKSVMEDAIEKYGKPEIVNTDQGSQYTSDEFIKYLKDNKIKISMDGKGRATDNIYIERLWRSVKYEDLYLRSYENGTELYHGVKEYFKFYNTERRHQNLDYSTPAEVFFSFKLPFVPVGVV